MVNCEVVVKSLGIKPERVREFINEINSQEVNIGSILCQERSKKKSF